MSILLFFAVLAILILSHEFGHFIVAKKNGIRVDEFAFGFPPRLFKFKKGETLYSFNLIPFGGFVKIHGEEGQDGKDPRSFASKSVFVRASVIVAGVIFNLLLAWFLISAGFLVGMPASSDTAPFGAVVKDAKIMIIQVQKGTPAEEAGLKAGDRLINFESIEAVQAFIAKNKGKEIEIKYERGGELFSARAIPNDILGIAMDEVGIINLPIHKALWAGAQMTYNLTIAIAVAIFYFIFDAIRGLGGFDQIMGPIGIVSVTGTAAQLGFGYLLSFIALLSINLAIINILPFPALDGGRLLFLAIEKIKGSPINYKFSSIVHTVGLALLLILMFAITYKDIMRLI